MLIDDFSQGPLKIQATNHAGLNVLQTGLGSSALGGSRLVHVGSLQAGTLTIETNTTRFNYFANLSLGYFTLTWGDSAQLFDLTTGGNNAFQMNFVNVTPGLDVSVFTFRVQSGDAWYRYDFSQQFAAAVLNSSAATISIPFSSFPGANLAQVQQIEIDAGRVEAMSSLALESVSAVPEPAAPAVFLAGILLIRLASSNRWACRFLSRGNPSSPEASPSLPFPFRPPPRG